LSAKRCRSRSSSRCDAIQTWSRTAVSRLPSRTSSMNRLVRLLLLSFPIVGMSGHAAEPRVQDLALDDHAVYSVPVSGTRVTTISFPSPITAIDGALLTLDGKTPGLFQV